MVAAAEGDVQATDLMIDWSSRKRRYVGTLISVRRKWKRRPTGISIPTPVASQVDVQSFPAMVWVRSLRQALYQPHRFASVQDCVGADAPMLIDMVRRRILPARRDRQAQTKYLSPSGRSRAWTCWPGPCSPRTSV